MPVVNLAINQQSRQGTPNVMFVLNFLGRGKMRLRVLSLSLFFSSLSFSPVSNLTGRLEDSQCGTSVSKVDVMLRSGNVLKLLDCASN